MSLATNKPFLCRWSIFTLTNLLLLCYLLCHEFPSPVLNLVNLEVVGLPEAPHLGHHIINPILVGLDVILQQLSGGRDKDVHIRSQPVLDLIVQYWSDQLYPAGVIRIISPWAISFTSALNRGGGLIIHHGLIV